MKEVQGVTGYYKVHGDDYREKVTKPTYVRKYEIFFVVFCERAFVRIAAPVMKPTTIDSA
jgi:hypothetical protein